MEELDPIRNLSNIDQIAANDRIASSHITQFDRTLYTQVLANPLAGKKDAGKGITESEIITVQLVRPCLEAY